MKVEVTASTTETARLVIPHELLVRFLRSLGAEIPDDARIRVDQPASYLSDSPQDVACSWTSVAAEETREIQLMDDVDIEVVAGLHDLERKSDKDDTPF